AFGLPIVCYDRGGQTDFLATPHTGHVVPLNDLAGMTAAVLELRRSPERREAIQRYNRTLVERYFIDRCAASYERLFEQAILAGQGRRASRERS
ncbi:MAG: glycosyltransferase, partial [Steroidobacteraceae bacterium]